MRTNLKFVICLMYSIHLYYKYKDRTMLSLRSYIGTLSLIGTSVDKDILKNGAIVECGTWRGGMAAGLIEFCGKNRSYYFFDSFEGLPDAKEIDGAAALEWQSNKNQTNYFDNCSASIDIFMNTIDRTGVNYNNVNIIKGFFEKTLPTFETPNLSVLRLDGDWYESTMLCLEKFWDSVVPGGIILIDDYYTWDGCARAIHDFLSKRQSTETIETGPVGRVAFIRKK